MFISPNMRNEGKYLGLPLYYLHHLSPKKWNNAPPSDMRERAEVVVPLLPWNEPKAYSTSPESIFHCLSDFLPALTPCGRGSPGIALSELRDSCVFCLNVTVVSSYCIMCWYQAGGHLLLSPIKSVQKVDFLGQSWIFSLVLGLTKSNTSWKLAERRQNTDISGFLSRI